jgi:putative intracellular protease/amidase
MSLFSRVLIAPIAASIAISVSPIPSSASDFAPSNVVETAASSGSAPHGELLSFLLESVADPAQFEGKRIAIVASDGASAFELETTRDYFMDRGARVHILAPRPADGAPMVGLAGFVPPRELITTLDYAGERRLASVTWYLDQVKPQDYDAIYVPNNLKDIERLAANAQTIRFLVAAQAARHPIFVTGNARAIVPGLDIPVATQPPDGVPSATPAAQDRRWQVYAGRDAFDMPQLIAALAATLADMPSREIN